MDSGGLQKAAGQVGRSPVPKGPVSRDRSSQYVIRAQKESRMGGGGRAGKCLKTSCLKSPKVSQKQPKKLSKPQIRQMQRKVHLGMS